MQKDSVLYKGMAKYRRKFLFINIILTILVVMYTINRLPYLKTKWNGPSALDTNKFLSETKTIVIDEIVELGRKDSKSPEEAYYKDTSYWQGDAYRFAIKADSVKKTDITFKVDITNAAGEVVSTKELYKLHMATVSGRKVAVLSYNGQDVKKDMTACLVKMPKSVLSEISKNLKEDETAQISEYLFDTRGLEMDTDSSDHVFFWVFLVMLVLLWARLISYYINPLSTPTYRQLARYGDIKTVADEINRQAKLPSAKNEGKELVLEDFIISKSDMKLKVVKNHMAKN